MDEFENLKIDNEILTEEQKLTYYTAKKSLLISGFLTEANFLGLFLLSNFIILMGKDKYSIPFFFAFVLCVVVNLSLLKMKRNANREHLVLFKEQVIKILAMK